MEYEQAIKKWGALKLKTRFPLSTIYEEDVRVNIGFDSGYHDPDPNSYGSFDYEGTCWVEIRDGNLYMMIDRSEFDLATIVREIVEVAG